MPALPELNETVSGNLTGLATDGATSVVMTASP